MDDILDGIRSSFKSQTISVPNYLKAYDNLYGVTRSQFKYKLPYLDDVYKSVESSWAGSGETADKFTGGKVQSIMNAFTMFSPGVGIDYSKSFQFKDTGPSHNLTFYLDNTQDSTYGTESVPNYETNFRFVYLLLYQNLPNRLNKIGFVPPVIYRAKLPGMFSYRYSFEIMQIYHVRCWTRPSIRFTKEYFRMADPSFEPFQNCVV